MEEMKQTYNHTAKYKIPCVAEPAMAQNALLSLNFWTR